MSAPRRSRCALVLLTLGSLGCWPEENPAAAPALTLAPSAPIPTVELTRRGATPPRARPNNPLAKATPSTPVLDGPRVKTVSNAANRRAVDDAGEAAARQSRRVPDLPQIRFSNRHKDDYGGKATRSGPDPVFERLKALGSPRAPSRGGYGKDEGGY